MTDEPLPRLRTPPVVADSGVPGLAVPDPLPSDPVPSDLVPSVPVPSDPVPSGPVPSGPVPSGPATNDPAPADSFPLLIAAARAGDQDAFATLYRDLHPRLLRYACVLVGQDAEDVVADSWLQIARDLGRFDGDLLQFRAWTARIVRNRAIDHVRAQARRPQRAAGLDAVVDRPSADDTAESAADAISTDAAITLIASLPRNQAEAVLLRAVVGLDPAGAGKVLGKRPGAVRVAAHRGLRALEEQLRPPEGRGERS